MIAYLTTARINIPLDIWQTGAVDFKDLEYPFPECVNTWKKMNPGYSYNYTSNQEKIEYIEQCGDSELIELSRFVKKEFLADLWRYLFIYNNGGIYVDLDSVCVAPLSMMKYNISIQDDIELIAKSIFGYNCNNNPTVKTNLGVQEYCGPCDSFCKKFETGPYSKKMWLDNNGFAAIPKSTPLKSVLDEIKVRFKEFKQLHNNEFDSSHESIKHIVDCSAFEVGINKHQDLVSKTFIYDRQSFSLDDIDPDDNKVFKKRFLDFEILQVQKVLFSEYEKSNTGQLK